MVRTTENTPLHSSFPADAISAAKIFVADYYNALNKDRGLIPAFYHPNATVAWNGNGFTGGEAFAAMFQEMPHCYYDVQSYDSQPMGRNEKGSTSIMMTVSGTVKYGQSSNKPRGFSDTIVLHPDEMQSMRFRIGSQSFRFVTP